MTEFEAATAPKPEPTQPATQPAATPQQALEPTLKEMLDDNLLQKRVDMLAGQVQSMYQTGVYHQDRAEFADLVSRADKVLKESGAVVSEDYAKRWLTSEAMLRPGLVAAFDQRHSSPEAQRQWARAEKKLMQSVLKEAKREPDVEAIRNEVAASNGSAQVRSWA